MFYLSRAATTLEGREDARIYKSTGIRTRTRISTIADGTEANGRACVARAVGAERGGVWASVDVDSHMVAAGRAVMPVPEGTQSHDNSLRKQLQMRLSKPDERGIAHEYSRLVDDDGIPFPGCSIYNGPRWQSPGPNTGCAARSGT